MFRFENHAATELAYGDIFGFSHEQDAFPGRGYFKQLDEVTLFADGILARIQECGFSAPKNDTNQAVAYVYDLCKKAGTSLSRQTIKNWLTKGSAASSAKGRDNVYQLCFALKMDVLQTAEFFLKCYLERPFDYKQLNEAVYFYCFNTGKDFKRAQELISEVQNSPKYENPFVEDVTGQIGKGISEISDDCKLVRYLVENRSGFVQKNKTATETIRQLIEDCIKIAQQENDAYWNEKEHSKITSIDSLLKVIYGYSARERKSIIQKDANGRESTKSKPTYAKSIANSDFPKLVRQNFPQRQQFENIKKGKASYDVIRKALIILKFYQFFAGEKNEGNDISNRFDDFKTEMDMTLLECGYIQLYWRNPFDWIIGYCVDASDPLDQLRDLIEEFYLSKFDLSESDFNEENFDS